MSELIFEDMEGKTYSIEKTAFVKGWNAYCEETGNADAKIYFNDDDFLAPFSKAEIARHVANGFFSTLDPFVMQNEDGDFFTSHDPLELIRDLTDNADIMDGIAFSDLIDRMKKYHAN